jgi:hypothetical protein
MIVLNWPNADRVFRSIPVLPNLVSVEEKV